MKTKEEKELETSIKEMTDFIYSLGLETEKRVLLTSKIRNYKDKLINQQQAKYKKIMEIKES